MIMSILPSMAAELAERLTGCLGRVCGVGEKNNDTGEEEGCRCRPDSLCSLIQQSLLGHERCVDFHNDLAAKARRMGEPLLSECHAGLMECAVPIGEEKQVLIFGQTVSKEVTQRFIRATEVRLSDLGLNRADLVSALTRMRPVAAGRVTESSQLLFQILQEEPAENGEELESDGHLAERGKKSGRSRRWEEPERFLTSQARMVSIWLRLGDMNQGRRTFVRTLNAVDEMSEKPDNRYFLFLRFRADLVRILTEYEIPIEGLPDCDFNRGRESFRAAELVRRGGDFFRKAAEHSESRDQRGAGRRLLSAVVQMEKMPAHRRNLKEVARNVGIAPQSLSRRFRQTLGISFREYRNMLRVGRIDELRSKHPEITSAEMARYVGLSDQSYVYKILREFDGRRPVTKKTMQN